MKYLRKTFSVPAGSASITDDEWARIFGTEESRKKKMKAAIAKRKAEKQKKAGR